MPDTQNRPSGKRSRAHDGQMAEGGRRAHDSQQQTRETPLDFAKSVFRDPGQPAALRVRMAVAAMPYMHKRGEEQAEEKPKRQELSDLELARRIARILELGRQQAQREGRPLAELGLANAAAAPVLNTAPPSPAAEPSSAPPAPRPAWREPEHVQPIDPFDPHPGYRWI